MGSRGSVFTASRVSIGIRFRYLGAECEERIKLAPTPRNLQYARNLRGRILDEIARGTFDYARHFPSSKRARAFAKDPGALDSVGDRLDAWLESVRPGLQHSTVIDYERAIKGTLKPAFGTLMLRDLTRAHVRTWIAGKDASAKRINNVLSPLRQMLAEAVSDGTIDADPMHGLSVRKKAADSEAEDIDPFTPDEVRAILDHCDGQVRNLLQFAFWTGMRTSELIALQWDDIDFRRGVAMVRRAKVRGQTKVTKTRAGKREVKLLPPALEAIQAQRAATQLRGAEVFLDPRTGEPYLGDKQLREWQWRPALRRAGVRYRRQYQTRHTYASTMLSAGENPVWVATQMGHKDWVMIVRTYGRWIPEVDPTAGEKAAAICGDSVGQITRKPHGA